MLLSTPQGMVLSSTDSHELVKYMMFADSTSKHYTIHEFMKSMAFDIETMLDIGDRHIRYDSAENFVDDLRDIQFLKPVILH